MNKLMEYLDKRITIFQGNDSGYSFAIFRELIQIKLFLNQYNKKVITKVTKIIERLLNMKYGPPEEYNKYIGAVGTAHLKKALDLLKMDLSKTEANMNAKEGDND
jgi:hypothetical protein